MRKLLVPMLFFVLAASCASPEDHVELQQSPIIGGNAASSGQFPTVVAVLNAGLCTGTLVAPDLVMTAAHCISPAVLGYSSQSQVTYDTAVRIGSTRADSGGYVIQAAATLPHPSFSESSLGRHDIGLIWLADSVTSVTPTVLNRNHADAPAGITTSLVGFGLTNPNNQYSSGTLYYLGSKPTVGCSSIGESDTYLLCYDQTNGTGSCSGDSGGPSFATIGGTRKLVGVTSFGDQYCQQIGAYTRIDAELDFLDANAPELACLEDGSCNTDCGSGGLPSDPDCSTAPCGLNGTCNPTCYSGGSSSDPDCPDCSSNGTCNAACGSGGIPADADCIDCSADGTCTAGCGSGGHPADPDCPSCVIDADCGDPNLECIDGGCSPIPDGPGGDLGDPCDANGDCTSGMCGAGPGGDARCVALCDPSGSDCPDGFDCLEAGDVGACWPTDGDGDESGVTGGCAVSGDSSGVSTLGLLLLLAVLRRRRRTAR